MSVLPDELEVNPFYKHLQTHASEAFEKAQESSCLVCIPHSRSLANVVFTKNFTDYHILKPSPYFQGQFMTSHSKGKMVTLDNDKLITAEGFPSVAVIEVLSEELAYSKTYRPYRFLIIEASLDPNVQRKRSSQKRFPEPFVKYSFKESRDLLTSFFKLEKVLVILDEDIAKFMRSYMILRDYLDDTATRLRSICIAAVQKCSSPHLQSDTRLTDVLNTAIENYVMGQTHSKLYPVICEQFEIEDAEIKQKLQQLSTLTGHELGIQPRFLCPLPSARVELGRIESLTTPYEKLQCVRTTMECIKNDIREHQIAHSLGVVRSEEMLFTSDDLIPILVSVLCECASKHVVSDIFYMEHFTWSLYVKDEFSFCLATFKACVEYSKNVNIQTLRVRYSVMDGDRHEGRDLDTTTGGHSIKSEQLATSPGSSLCHIERQLDKMARLLDQSSSHLSGHLQKTAQEVGSSVDSRKKSDLGAFLSALQDDDFGPSIGKK